MQTKQIYLLSCLLMASGSAAFAQAPPTPVTPQAQTAPAPIRTAADCAPTQANPQQGTLQPRDTTTTGQAAEPLSDKLAKSDGVLCPPSGVDAEIHAPTPNTGTMPVIPPPGSPGGDPGIRPK